MVSAKTRLGCNTQYFWHYGIQQVSKAFASLKTLSVTQTNSNSFKTQKLSNTLNRLFCSDNEGDESNRKFLVESDQIRVTISGNKLSKGTFKITHEGSGKKAVRKHCHGNWLLSYFDLKPLYLISDVYCGYKC